VGRVIIVRMTCMIVPPYLLQRLAALDDPAFAPAAAAARASLSLDVPFREVRTGEASPGSADTQSLRAPRGASAEEPRGPNRTICDANGSERLPGVMVRGEGDRPTGDRAADEAYDGLGHTHDLFRAAFERASVDGANLPLEATVHFGEAYDNAFWDGERMVFGDGDGVVFTRMTASLSVIGHELAHGVTQYSANLVYEGQSGALNESVSDVFGALVEQRTFGQNAEEASWLIGHGLFTDAVEGSALRSMSAPGTAYNDDVLGTDPQPAHMDDYITTRDDHGGVHLNSGIPNRAFYLTAVALGGFAWERAGRIWYDTLIGELSTTADFATFASATIDAAAARYGRGSAEEHAVRSAWSTVGVIS
jgi:Zn-dependent metalloprotease